MTIVTRLIKEIKAKIIFKDANVFKHFVFLAETVRKLERITINYALNSAVKNREPLSNLKAAKINLPYKFQLLSLKNGLEVLTDRLLDANNTQAKVLGRL